MSKFFLVMLAVITLLSGCTSIVSYPVSNPEPFLKKSKIGLYTTSRDQIVSLFGQPHLKLNEDEIWVYGQSRITWERVPPPHEHEFYALMIKFEQDLASSYEIVEGNYVSGLCWSNDLCLEGHWISMEEEHGPKILDREFSAVTSSGSDDQAAKSFIPARDDCLIYVFKSFDFFQLPYPPSVSLGRFNDEPIPAAGYLFVKIKPGTHRLLASDQHVDFQCDAGDLIYYAVSNRGFVTEPITKIENVSDREGKAEIRDRKILVTW